MTLIDLRTATLPDIIKLPGLADLHMKVKGPFAQALKAEANGDIEKANQRLAVAIDAEFDLKTNAA